MGAGEIRGSELEIKPSWGAMRACRMSLAPGVPAQRWLWCRGCLLSPSPSLPEREVVSTLPPAERKVSFKPLKISARATIYPGHFPEPSPPALLPPAPGSPGFLPPGCFSGHTKGWHGWMRALLGRGFVCSRSAYRCHNASSLSSHHCRGVPKVRDRAPISRMGGGSRVPWPGDRIQALHPTSQPTSSRDVPWGAWGTPSPAPPGSGTGLLALLLASLVSCREQDRVHMDTLSRLLSH